MFLRNKQEDWTGRKWKADCGKNGHEDIATRKEGTRQIDKRERNERKKEKRTKGSKTLSYLASQTILAIRTNDLI